MKKKVLKILIFLVAVAFIISAASAVVCSFSIKTPEYSVTIEGLKEEARIVCLSDLHGRSYGENNEKLLSLVEEQKPDAIFVLGDMISSDADREEVSCFLELMTRLKEIAPVFFSPGNHEMDYMIVRGDDLMSRISETGAVALCDEFIDTEIAGNTIRIGGSLGHYYRYEWTAEQKENPPDYAMEEEIGSAEIPALVMLHMPESLVADCAAERWTGDLYFCGHTHGGVIRVPGVGGLYAPTQGFFPKYDCGQFESYGHDMIITSGLSGYKWLPRVFNRPEICLVTLTPEK